MHRTLALLVVLAVPGAPEGAPKVCQQYEESAGTCRDSHNPVTHLWPRPFSVNISTATLSPVTLTDTSLVFAEAAASQGGPILRAGLARYHAQIFDIVQAVAPPFAKSPIDPVTVLITVRDREQPPSPTTSMTELDESYRLEVAGDGGGTIAANTSIGALRALETFSQLIEYSMQGEVQLWHLPISVVDRPRWKHRAVKVDTSRHFIRLSHLQNIIRGMEASKMNVLQWHIIDGQSFPLESKLYPELAEKGRYCSSCTYSQEDVRELVAFARQHGVRVIPEIDIPGHSGFQYGMPEIVACPFFEEGQGSNRAIDPTLDITYSFLTEFLAEQAELFGDPVINVYGDEVRFACWNQSKTIATWMRSHGIAAGDFQALTEVFWRRFAKEVAPAVYNRTGVAVMIGEANVFGTDGPPFEFPGWLTDAAPGYPLPLTVEVWGGTTLDRSANGTLRKVLSTPGMQAVVGGAYYLDQDLPRPFSDMQESTSMVYKAPYWVSVWRTMYSFDPVGDPALSGAQKRRVIGLVSEMWGEQINSATIEQRIFPHALAVGERGWTDARHFHPSGLWDPEFYGAVEGRLNAMSCTLNRRGVRSSPSAPGFCSYSKTF